MAKLPSKPKPKVRWSEETIRQRGVRAVVAAMRLNKEHRRLRLENACYVEETRVLRKYLEQLRAVNSAVRELLKQRKNSSARDTKNHNPWMNNGDSHLENGGSSKGT
jgi:hypothetical protein